MLNESQLRVNRNCGSMCRSSRLLEAAWSCDRYENRPDLFKTKKQIRTRQVAQPAREPRPGSGALCRKRNRYFNGTMAIAIGFPSGLWISPDRPKVPYGYLWGSMPYIVSTRVPG